MSDITAVPLRPIRKATLVWLWAGIALLLTAGVALAWTGTAKQVAMAEPPANFLARNAKAGGVVTLPSGLQYKVLREGAGDRPTMSDLVIVDYDGKLLNGSTFDASSRHGGPSPLPVAGMIPGWTEGVQLMTPGSKYRFWMPPELAYGEQGAGDGLIPPNSVLVFDLSLIAVAPQQPGMGMPGMSGEAPPR
jgi:FKBP-type peptidyl-prolyl cis-trans isomerase FkpA